ncbi:MAG TPA: hypothetical protein VM842_06195 [Nitrospira sp.]|nr:hypothetical protein [Nitrospira sp.]
MREATVHYLIAMACSVGFLLAGSAMHALWPNWRWYHEPLHASIEAVGGLAAIAMAAVLFHRPQRDAVAGKYRALAAGFLGMGILEEFHAVVAPGNAFVLFRNLASLVGGVGFLSIFRTGNRVEASPRRWLPWVIAIGALSVGTWFLAAPDTGYDAERRVYSGCGGTAKRGVPVFSRRCGHLSCPLRGIGRDVIRGDVANLNRVDSLLG